jgi:hypothetical protein
VSAARADIRCIAVIKQLAVHVAKGLEQLAQTKAQLGADIAPRGPSALLQTQVTSMALSP